MTIAAALATTPSIVRDISLTPQAKTVLRHLEKVGSLSPMKALIVYNISRLAACVYEIRKAGYDVTTRNRRDAQGHKYSDYYLNDPFKQSFVN